MTYNIELQRIRADKIVTVWLWVHVPLIAAMTYYLGANVVALTGTALAAAALSTLLVFTTSKRLPGRIVVAFAAMIQISLAVAALQDHPWQVDMHMYYFAMLAVLVSYVDWRIIAAGTAAVAVHHLGLNYFYAAAVYPGGSDLGRVVLHAVILIAEAVVLMGVSWKMNDLIANLGATVAQVEAAGQASQRQQQDNMKLISTLTDGLSKLARKDLSIRIADELPSLFSKIGSDFDIALQHLERVISAVASSSEKISSGTDEISQASTDLSRRTEAQAANLEEASAALAEITRSVKETSTGAKDARAAVELAQSEARSGSEVVTQAVDAIKRIEKVSSQITHIIDVIDEISFQTNLLALNAGVEAARAGEFGRGFAVVASEVRSLAQRSTEAARNIKELINTSISEVSEGVRLVESTGKALDRIVTRVNEVNERIKAMANSADVQANGIAEVSVAVGEIDRTTQQNAAMVEQAAAATVALNQQSEALQMLIREFAISSEKMRSRSEAA